MNNNKAPLILWCSSHKTLAAEEIPLLLEAGFRVIPLMTDFWTFEYAPSLDSQICGDWKKTIDLPSETIQRLQAIRFYKNEGQNDFCEKELELLREHVDIVYLSVLPNLAIRLAKVFPGTVLFRPFGHGSLNTYTRIAEHLKVDLDDLAGQSNYMWAPILTTLQSPEDPRICANAHPLGAFVSKSRLGDVRWSPSESEPYVVETIPRIEKQSYYKQIFSQFVQDHGQLPLKILGGNSRRGGGLNDQRIVGFLDDEEYYRVAARARLCIYHGRSHYHLHYHPIEFMALGIPVLFHRDSALAAEGMQFGMSEAQLVDAGMFYHPEQANEMARAAFANPYLAAGWSEGQRYFMNEVFNRKKVLDQARWLKSRVLQHQNWLEHGSSLFAGPVSLSMTTRKRSIPHRVLREVKRVIRRAKGKSVVPKVA